jgi:hypothetical protein
MKANIKLFFILFSVVLCAGLTACGDDDDDKQSGPAKAVTGTYVGDLTMSGVAIGSDATIKIEFVSDNKVNLKLKETVLNIPMDIICETTVVPDAKLENTYALTGTTAIKDFSMGGAPFDLPVAIEGTAFAIKIAGISAKAITLNIKVGEGLTTPPFPVTVVFDGSAE